jgi:hypothetical protein
LPRRDLLTLQNGGVSRAKGSSTKEDGVVIPRLTVAAADSCPCRDDPNDLMQRKYHPSIPIWVRPAQTAKQLHFQKCSCRSRSRSGSECRPPFASRFSSCPHPIQSSSAAGSFVSHMVRRRRRGVSWRKETFCERPEYLEARKLEEHGGRGHMSGRENPRGLDSWEGVMGAESVVRGVQACRAM